MLTAGENGKYKTFSKASAVVSRCPEQAHVRVSTVSSALWNLKVTCQDSRHWEKSALWLPRRALEAPGHGPCRPQIPGEPRGAQNADT